MIASSFMALGGLGLFMLAMTMLTDGLKALAGRGLRHMLSRWTRTPAKGAASGALLTALVQSSSAVTIAIIGFVNAGILAMPQALGVVFGANLGTTITGWLVSLTGFEIDIAAYALPLVGMGSLLVLIAGRGRQSDRPRLSGLGRALTGFGLFFLGLSFLKSAFSGFETSIGLAAFGAGDLRGIAIMLTIGFFITVLTQSSSAAIALIITAASQGTLSLPAAASAVIGANLGTTSTAFLAGLNATPAARRVAAGHIVFNGITGLIAIVILPFLIIITRRTGHILGLGEGPAITLALFHTLFNLLGLILLLPAADYLARYLNRLFHTDEEDIATPRHLDRTLLNTPMLAIAALLEEITRMRLIVADHIKAAFLPDEHKPTGLLARARGIKTLGNTIGRFAIDLSISGMPRNAAQAIPDILRVARYLEDSASHAPHANSLRRSTDMLKDEKMKAALNVLLEHSRTCIDNAGLKTVPPDLILADELGRFEQTYHDAKATLLQQGVKTALDIDRLDRLLDDLSTTRRMTEQFVKAARSLNTLIANNDTHAMLNADIMGPDDRTMGANNDEIPQEIPKSSH